ncbi:phosphatidylinositol 3,4,5-trisphosphate 3-phosphatase and dual-specificity protein phosphatase PTEN [Physcia stellaris]|nr:phosphatidylinositol 3,4,5-trisphosphate 3-phosphatase and dual-specificity protein phosphatase PTEN [Physcia stellaris]
MASMRDWLKGSEKPVGRVVVVHCKAGKGRSGSVACSYLVSEEGWKVSDALARFTERRMRSGFGAGISIPSQLRWVGYVDRWTKHQKLYVERQIEILEVHAWGLRDGVKIAIEGFIDEGKVIKTFHVFSKSERISMDDTQQLDTPLTDGTNDIPTPTSATASTPQLSTSSSPTSTATAIFRPHEPIILPTSDICIDLERRNKATYGWTMVTSVAHVWFNAFFEGRGPENHGDPTADGVFEISWEAMDGIKGSPRKGTKALDRVAVVWRAVPADQKPPVIITEPKEGEVVPEERAADWRLADKGGLRKDLGLRTESPTSRDVSRASSVKSGVNEGNGGESESEDGARGVKTHGPDGEDHVPHPKPTKGDDGAVGQTPLDGQGIGEVGHGKTPGVVQDMKDEGSESTKI